ncbi:Sulfotransferase family protein [Aquimixticola soesokkakensis]|uniref:Sulfotransferase family protein n=1 Tax=Aquimixticola soesokkakensis TaxID=1519096 RepID=A0A1Y5TMQ1_9RHOB|nr:sulfotransferase family 2 domain-containing protein [Aquimixticola soesokkakensis]SLN67488.1 Sulfotransferase family protein [Aquimixticola soesokkakensis]
MIISPGRKFIFVHIPKTGGTALSLALEDRAQADDLLIGDTPKALRRRGRVKRLQGRGKIWKHATLADIEGVVDAAQMEQWFTLALVRNPWDRAVSYYHWLRAQGWEHPQVALAKARGFSAFLNHPDTQRALSVPASHYMRDSAGREHARLYARLEHLDRDLAPFWDHLGFSLSPIQRINASTRDADWRSYYSDHDLALIARLAAEDIARFGYGNSVAK